MKFTQQFWKGLWAPLGAVRFLRGNRGLKRFLLLPMLLDLLVFVGLYALAWDQSQEMLMQIADKGDTWYWIALYRALLVVVVILLLLLVGLCTALLAGVVAAPFNDLLAERTLNIVDGEPNESFSVIRLGQDVSRSIIQQIRKLVFIVCCASVLFLLQFVPGLILVIQFFLYPLFTAFTASLEFMDYGMERRRLRFKQKRKFLMRHSGAVMGFGGSSALLLMVPVLNVLAMPVLVVAGTLMYLSIEKG
jgi:CysZ protein